jgi:hypothetical protein
MFTRVIISIMTDPSVQTAEGRDIQAECLQRV